MGTSKGDFAKYLEERYGDQVEWYDSKAIQYKKINDCFQILIIIIAAIVPVLAALDLKILTILSSAIVAAGTGVLKFKKFDEIWRNYRTICETLKKEKNYYDYKVSVYNNADDPEALFIERVESLISKENTTWYSIMSKGEDKGQ